MFLAQAIPHPQISWMCKNAFLHGCSLEWKKKKNRKQQICSTVGDEKRSFGTSIKWDHM